MGLRLQTANEIKSAPGDSPGQWSPHLGADAKYSADRAQGVSRRLFALAGIQSASHHEATPHVSVEAKARP